MIRPRLNPVVLLAPAEDGYLAYHVELGQLHRLNPTATLLVDLCDGARTEAEILEIVAPLLGEEQSASCSGWLRQAIKQQLLIVAESSPPHVAKTAAELHAMAKSLRGRDRVLAAYICQRHAAELAPNESQHWYALGELAHIVGRREEARAAYERYQQAYPDDIEVEHLLVALRDDAPPSRAPDAYIEQLYSYFAGFYDQNMLGDLDYRAPDLLFGAIRSALNARRDLCVLELGCGTGLFGQLIRPLARRLIGIDLSAAMIERARERGIYDELATAEITAWLSQNSAQWFDLIAICDTLIYFGDLRQVLPAAERLLAPGGILAFTVEQAAAPPFRLTDSGRFAHHVDHLREVTKEAGLCTISQTAEVLRYEYGEAVTGSVTVARRADDGSVTAVANRCLPLFDRELN